jgi:hypothetical protein
LKENGVGVGAVNKYSAKNFRGWNLVVLLPSVLNRQFFRQRWLSKFSPDYFRKKLVE